MENVDNLFAKFDEKLLCVVDPLPWYFFLTSIQVDFVLSDLQTLNHHYSFL